MDTTRSEGIDAGLRRLPVELLGIIFDYIPPTSKVWLNKRYYNMYNHLIRGMIPDDRFNSYVTSIIRNDDAFVFEHVMVENKEKWFADWLNNKRYRYNNTKYNCFLYFLYEHAIECGSNKCRNVIEHYATSMIGPKWHRKNRPRSFRNHWTN